MFEGALRRAGVPSYRNGQSGKLPPKDTPAGALRGGASCSLEDTKSGPSGVGTIVKTLPWGVQNRSYQTSWSKEAPVGGTEGGRFM